MPTSGCGDRDTGGVNLRGAGVSRANGRADAQRNSVGGCDAILGQPDGVERGENVSDSSGGMGRVPDGGLMVNDD